VGEIRSLAKRIIGRLGREAKSIAPGLAERAEQRRVLRSFARERRRIDDIAGDPRPLIVFFAPEAGVVPHFMAHCLIAKSLQERGHRVLIVGCAGVFQRCIVMDGRGLPLDAGQSERRRACYDCGSASLRMTTAYGLDVIDIKEFVSARVLKEIDRSLVNLPADLTDFRIDGHRFGDICGAEAAVTFKSSDLKGETPSVRALLVQYLKNMMISYRAMQQMAKRLPIARLVYFSEYAMLMGAVLAARSAGIPTLNMTMASVSGVDRRRIVLMPELLAIESYRRRLDRWPLWRDLALPAEVVAEIGSDCIYRISSNSSMVYSPVRVGNTDKIFEQLGLSSDRQVLVAFTSSLDEISANNQLLKALDLDAFGEKQPFRDQIEWLEALIAFVERSGDLQLVIRIHPREGANRREKVVSQHLQLLRERFSRRYENVRVIWPEDPVSSYDLMEIADIGLSGWSSTALELARFGTPVVIAFNWHTPFPVGDVVTWDETPDRYFARIDEALARSPSFDLIRFSYRWSHSRSLGCMIDLGDVVPDSDFHGLPPYRTPRAAPIIEDVVGRGVNVLDVNEERLRSNQGPAASRLEDHALRTQLRRCIWFLCFGEDTARDYRLYCSDSAIEAPPAGYDASITCDDGIVELRTASRRVRRRSKIAARMALLAAQNLQLAETEFVDVKAD
jgi:hypothetical protein